VLTNASDRNGTTALMFAALEGYTEIVRLLLAQGADLNMQRKVFGVTALMLAAANHQVDIVQTLTGAQVNAKMTTAVQR